jgi:hypothetical protein
MKNILIAISIIVIILSYLIYNEIDTLDTIELDSDTDAQCLDGTNYKFEISKGFDDGVNKFLLFFEGGGWCIFNTDGYNYEKCLERTQISWGSSKPLWKRSSKLSRLFYILSSNKKFNPVFYNWNKILVRYCDGFGHQGYSKKPIVYKDKELFIRGHNNTMGIIDYLKTNANLMDADRLVLAGHSAGGTAALYWSNYIKNVLNPITKVSTVVDSGIFLDVSNYNDTQHKMKDNWIKVYSLTHSKHDSFMTSFCNLTVGWKCFMPENLITTSKVPVLILHSLYDSWSIYRLVGDFCIFKDRQMLAYCNDTSHIEDYKNKLLDFFRSINDKGNVNFWLTHCVTHSFLYAVQDVFDEKVGISRVPLTEAINQWLYNPENYKNAVENRNFDFEECERVKDLYYYVNYFGYPTS